MSPRGRRRGPGLLVTTAVVGTTAYVATSAANKNAAQKQAAAQQQAAQQQAAAAPPAPAPGTMTDEKMAQLKNLGDLKASGVLTEEEFAAQKAKILAS